jgi:hypothetical protein
MRTNSTSVPPTTPKSPTPLEQLPDDLRPLTYRESANLLGVCQKTVENICRVRKEIPITWIGQKPRIRYRDLIAYIERGGSQVPQSN